MKAKIKSNAIIIIIYQKKALSASAPDQCWKEWESKLPATNVKIVLIHANYSSFIEVKYMKCFYQQTTVHTYTYIQTTDSFRSKLHCRRSPSFMSMQQRPQASTLHLFTGVLFIFFSVNCLTQILFNLENFVGLFCVIQYVYHCSKYKSTEPGGNGGVCSLCFSGNVQF